MICVNELTDLKCNKRAILEPLVVLISPYAPHFAEELWHLLGHPESVTKASFPQWKEEYLVENEFEYPVSINGKVKFKKPISCHLYPIRVSSIVDTDALNYHKWEICKPACSCGEKLKVPVYKFLKEPLERAYGAEWYTELEDTAKAWVLAHKKC
jgi:leucyl-tRNA synthetase